ncbi:hypothetical protein PQ455_01615 [Sphingomonas naphthae]|uniref:Uncharacterized protein n=1 Tax=Sphingomonas naphthae TaxID=1813468 RepID=A0ABY7TLT6_9SPHN|nr:hypothetical protein [Sphingomonas naphthae]WCT73958.1 hypothetical protein PQ455_01615 [Sphingomonas naphthae]
MAKRPIQFEPQEARAANAATYNILSDVRFAIGDQKRRLEQLSIYDLAKPNFDRIRIAEKHLAAAVADIVAVVDAVRRATPHEVRGA